MKFTIHVVPGYLHQTSTVSERPHVHLHPWKLVKVKDEDGTIERHLIGGTGFSGRVSSSVVCIDVAEMTATTSTGRVYTLGSPGPCRDGEWVFAQWLRINDCTLVKDQTSALVRLNSRLAKSKANTPVESPEMLALSDAFDLLQDLRREQQLPEDVRHELTYCLRHYPDVFLGGVDYWNISKGGEA